MAKSPREQQRTDAGRIGDAATGKLDQRGTPPMPEPVHRESVEESTHGSPHPPEFIARMRERLEREREAAIEQLRALGISPDTDETAPRAGTDSVLDEGDQAQASQREDMSLLTRQRVAERINRLTAALERIQQGRYGICSVCGRPIEAARLEAIPEAGTCLACQERGERETTPAAA